MPQPLGAGFGLGTFQFGVAAGDIGPAVMGKVRQSDGSAFVPKGAKPQKTMPKGFNQMKNPAHPVKQGATKHAIGKHAASKQGGAKQGADNRRGGQAQRTNRGRNNQS